ncbi:MAG: penicillin-binding protein 2 [Bacteroidota bacterium]
MKDHYQNRKFAVQILFVLGAVALLFRTAQLQLFDRQYQQMDNVTGVQEITIHPARGLIYDRNGKLLVYNDALYDIQVTYNQVRELDTVKFCNLLSITPEDFNKSLQKDFKRDPRYSEWIPFVFLRKVSSANYAKFQENLYQFPGFFADLRNVRGYNHPAGAHVLGYISEVNERQIAASNNYYQGGDYIGTTGLERQYEEMLRGKRGKEYVMKDNLGRVEGSYRNGEKDEPAISGKDLITTLDIDLQEYGELLMGNKKGSIVAIEPSTGEILSMVSSPSYEPEMLAINRTRSEEFTKLHGDSLKPLMNRALIAQYPPGSIFKPVMSLIGLQEGILYPRKGITCRGAYYYNNRRFGCREHPEPIRNMAKALQYSCNTYYFQAFRDIIDKNGYENAEMGLDTVVSYLEQFGLGQTLGIDLAGELPGNIPDSDYYDKVYGQGVWRSPFIISLGIGQGELLFTPMQMANLAAIIGNRGFYYTPHFAKQFKDDDNLILQDFQKQYKTSIAKEHYEAVIDGMELAVAGGSGRIDGIPYCGKTGTAQNPHGEDHSAFLAFAPKDDPKIAIAVFVENSGFGSLYARPIASLLIEKYLRGDIDRENPRRVYLENQMLKADLIAKENE